MLFKGMKGLMITSDGNRQNVFTQLHTSFSDQDLIRHNIAFVGETRRPSAGRWLKILFHINEPFKSFGDKLSQIFRVIPVCKKGGIICITFAITRLINPFAAGN